MTRAEHTHGENGGSPSATLAPEGATRQVELSILMPCLNEARTLGTCIRKAREYLQTDGIDGEIVVADNGSTDGSQALAESLGARVVPVAMRGYGAALYYGTLATRGKYVIMGDSDDSYDFRALRPFIEQLRHGHDLVMGNRFAGRIEPGAMPWKNRYIGNPLLSGLGRLLFRSAARDFHSGLRGYSRSAFDRMDLRTTGMEFASEMLIKATLAGMKVSEVPTTLSPDGRDRPPHLRPWRDGWRHLRFMLLYSPRWLFLYPGVVLMGAGLLMMLWLLPGMQSVAGIRFDVHTLVYAAMAILVGAQAVAFAVLTKIFAIQEGLMPPDRRLSAVIEVINLERGLLIGGALFLAGLAGSVASVIAWGAEDFGSLNSQVMLRLVIPSATAITLGVQVILFSFFASVLGLKVRKWPRDAGTSEAAGPGRAGAPRVEDEQ